LFFILTGSRLSLPHLVEQLDAVCRNLGVGLRLGLALDDADHALAGLAGQREVVGDGLGADLTPAPSDRRCAASDEVFALALSDASVLNSFWFCSA
jgi:hypothetical protein